MEHHRQRGRSTSYAQSHNQPLRPDAPMSTSSSVDRGLAFIQRYNRNRQHSTQEYLTPEEAELRYRHELPLAA